MFCPVKLFSSVRFEVIYWRNLYKTILLSLLKHCPVSFRSFYELVNESEQLMVKLMQQLKSLIEELVWVAYFLEPVWQMSIEILVDNVQGSCVSIYCIIIIISLLTYKLGLIVFIYVHDPSIEIVGDIWRLQHSNVYWHQSNDLSYTSQWWIWHIVLVRRFIHSSWCSQDGNTIYTKYHNTIYHNTPQDGNITLCRIKV